MADYIYVIMFKDKGKWEKAIAHGAEEKEILMCLHTEDSAFVKRYCIVRTGGKLFFDSLAEAEEKSQAGDGIQVAAPPSNFSDKSEDVEFYYRCEDEEDPDAFSGPQGSDEDEYDKLPIAEEDMMTDITEEEAMPLGDGEDKPEK
jgi:hypothetical protein